MTASAKVLTLSNQKTMSITLIILLIGLGLIFIILEILVIPGVGVVGVFGGMLIMFAVFSAYKINTNYGHVALASSLVLSAAAIYFSLKSNTWKKLSLNNSVEGRANVIDESLIKAGDTGTAISRLAPMGKALINGNYYEVQSSEGYITENAEITVVKVNTNKIMVCNRATIIPKTG